MFAICWREQRGTLSPRRRLDSSHRPRLIAQAAGVLTAPALLLLLSGCAAGSGGPRIAPLNPPAPKADSGKPINIRGNVVDSTNHRPIQLAHVSYNQQVISSDASGGFSFSGVPSNQTLTVVASGYGRYNAVWNPSRAQIGLTPLEVRGLYMPFAGLDDPTILATIDRYTLNTEINSVVLEVKTDDGEVSTQMATLAAIESRAVVGGYDVKGFIQRMHERNIYVVGRFVVFRDPALAKAHPEYALKRPSNGQPFADEQGEKWIDAFRQEVWQYNLDLAEKAAQLGLDEIQFDYVRFPGTDQPLDYAELMTEDNRIAAISGFLKRAEGRLRPYGIAISADTFGLTTVATDDTGIGQDIASLGSFIDYYCPMVYPSTWADGSLGVAYPPAEPYTIVYDSVQSAVRRLANVPTVKVRPWLQAFDDYKRRQLDYTPDKINIQKDASVKAGGTGWMLWDPASRYPAGAIGPSERSSAPALR
ncbi:MAG TPA: putative glycoside hydrolase [Dehalococcoidia bacterium]|nr:putative glycoside hydrolase [Dehalococcoidia bacterium]